jgi:hypothetical protein
MAEPQYLQGDPAALSMYSCDKCDESDCVCYEEDPDRLYDEGNSF